MISTLDRPSNNTLKYLTTVKGHKIIKDPQLKDSFVEQALTDLIGKEALSDFDQYTRSFYTLEGHYANLWLYDRVITEKPSSMALDMAKRITAEAMQLPTKVRSISWNQLNTVPYIPSSGAGYGYIGKKGDGNNHKIAINRAVGSLLTWHENPTAFRYTPDLAWTRTQLGTFESPKIRNVWGKAFHNIIIEGINAAPLIEGYHQKGEPIVVGIHLYKRLTNIIYSVLQLEDGTPCFGVGIDYKSFDTCAMPWLIRDAFDILKQNIEFTDPQAELAWEYSLEFFINTPVVMPDGRMWLKQLGIPSGSYFTQLVGSVINHILMNYIQIKLYQRVFPTWVLGDDSAFGVPYEYGFPDLEAISQIAAGLGYIIHPHKVVVATRPDEMEFLGHVARGTRVHRDEAKMLRLALFPEYPVLGPNESITRIKGLLVDSALNNWPIIHLHDYMRARYRDTEPSAFLGEDKNWLQVIVGLKVTPSEIDVVRAWTLT